MSEGPSSSDIFDSVERVYACAETVTPGLPHLRRVGNTWGVVRSLGRYSTDHWPGLDGRKAEAYAWAARMSAALVVTCESCGAASYGNS